MYSGVSLKGARSNDTPPGEFVSMKPKSMCMMWPCNVQLYHFDVLFSNSYCTVQTTQSTRSGPYRDHLSVESASIELQFQNFRAYQNRLEA